MQFRYLRFVILAILLNFYYHLLVRLPQFSELLYYISALLLSYLYFSLELGYFPPKQEILTTKGGLAILHRLL